jgi:putative RecB family exonuclease
MEHDNNFYLSFSRLSTYIKCPMRYKFIYVDNLPTIPRSYFSFGNSIHKVLETFYHPEKNFIELGKSPYKYMLELLDASWISDGYSSNLEEIRAKNEAKKILTDFYRKSIFAFRPALFVEKSFSFNIENFELKGRIDRIDERAGHFTIVDYKTNSIMPDLFREEDFLQPVIYYIAGKEILNTNKIDAVSLYFLKFDKKINFSFDDSVVEKSKKRIHEIGTLIQKGDFRAKANGNCSNCEFRNICLAFSGK